jgi:hypothetical protein
MVFETEKTELAANVPSIDMNLVRKVLYAPSNGFLAPYLLNREGIAAGDRSFP